MNITHAGSILHKLIFKIAGDDKRQFVEIAFFWKNLVGSILASKAYVHKLDKRVLFIAVNNSVWMQELILRKTYLIEQIKQKLNIELKDIVFFITDDLNSYRAKGLK